MSKELDLIKAMKILLECTDMDALQSQSDALIGRAIELLAQPEPVAWCQMVKGKVQVQDLLTSFEMKDWIKDDSWTPLYTAPPKREPLSEDEIFNIGYKAGFAIDHVESDDGESTDYGFIDGDGYIDNDLVFKFVRGIEKAHGIGE